MPTNVDEFTKRYVDNKFAGGLGYASDNEGFNILDKAQSVQQFKEEWLDYAIRKYLGEQEGVQSISIDMDNISIKSNKNKPVVEFQTLSGIKFSNDESKTKFMQLVMAGMDNGTKLDEVMDKVFSLYNVTNMQEQDDKNFTATTSVSKYTQTYDASKDEKFIYLNKLLKLQQENGISVFELMEKLDKKIDMVV